MMANPPNKSNNKANEALGLTPYQGTKRTYGFFKCEECKSSWTSAWSWRDTAQKCKGCLVDIYPFRQRELKKSGKKKSTEDASKRHHMDKCGKCIRNKRPCCNYNTS